MGVIVKANVAENANAKTKLGPSFPSWNKLTDW